MTTLLPRAAARPVCLAMLAAGWLVTPAVAAEPFRWRTDYPAARAEAEAKGLPLMITVGSDECLYCKKLAATTFRDPAVAALVAGKFVPLKVDATKDQKLVQDLRVQLLPTTILAGPDGKVLAFMQGFVTAEQFRDHAEAAARKATPAVTDLAVRSPTPPAPEVAARPPAPARTAASERGRAGREAELIALARDDFRAGRFADCLTHAEQVPADRPEAREAGELAARVNGDPDRLAAACEQAGERAAALNLALADVWLKKGQPREAAACLEKVVKLAPHTPQGEAARGQLARLNRQYPASQRGTGDGER